MVIWITGRPGAGKTTLARKLVAQLPNAVLLDGDEVREWLTPDAGFTPEGRELNLVRIARVAQLLEQAGAIPVVATVSPTEALRQAAFAHLSSSPILFYVNGSSRPDWGDIPYEPPPDAIEVVGASEDSTYVR